LSDKIGVEADKLAINC